MPRCAWSSDIVREFGYQFLQLNPYTLNHMDRQMLKQAFKQARRLQSLLEVDSQAPAIVKAKGDFAPFAEDPL